MKIAVVGPGAMGLLFAGFLKKAGNDVILLDKNPDRAKKIKWGGIRIEGISGDHHVKIETTHNAKDVKDCDLVLLCVKSYDTQDAIKEIKPAIKDEAVVLTLQNGIGNVEIIEKYIDKEKILAGVTNQGATLLWDGHIRHAGKGETVIGSVEGKVIKEADQVRNILSDAGFETIISTDVNSFLWSKLVISAGINALTAVTRLKNGRLIEINETKQILEKAVNEAALVASKLGIKIIYDDPIEKTQQVCRLTAENTSSMLQDVLKKKRTEIDFINGAVVRYADELKFEVPVNLVLRNLVKTIESSYGIAV